MAEHVNGRKSVASIVFVACILLGVAIGMLTDKVAIGSIIGVAVGFIAMAILRSRNL